MRRNLVSDIWIIVVLAALTVLIYFDIKSTERLTLAILKQGEILKSLTDIEKEFIGQFRDVVGDWETHKGGSKGVTNGKK